MKQMNYKSSLGWGRWIWRHLLPGIGLCLFGWTMASAVESPSGDAGWKKAEPLLAKYCYDCHGGKKTKGDVDLKRLEADPLVGKEFELWSHVQEKVNNGEMPPKDKKQLSSSEKKKLQQWLAGSLEAAVRANAGDPGPVTLRRLTNAEYDYTIRDLTGINYGLSRDFQPDGGGGEGFSNIGDVLFVNPQQLDKYLVAAKTLADHATIMPGTGITFQPNRVGLRGPDQLKAQAEQSLYVWYQKMAAPYLPKDDENLREADYMLACWKYKFREQTGATSLDQLAKEEKLLPAFLTNWWSMLNNKEPKSRFLDLTRVPWQQLPGPDAQNPKAVPAAVLKTLDEIQDQRRAWYDPKRTWATIQRVQQDSDGLQFYPLDAHVQGKKQVYVVIGDVADGNKGDSVVISEFRVERAGRKLVDYVAWLESRLKSDQADLKSLEAGKAASSKLDANTLKTRVEEAEKAVALFGDHTIGKEAMTKSIALKAPAVVPLPLPEDAVRFRARGKLDVYTDEAESASVQWMATAEAPPNPSTVFPGVITVWKRQSPTQHQVMHEFEVMRSAFPDIYDRRLEEVARNYYRNGHGPGVYYFSDDQLSALLPEAEKQHMKQMLEDWRFVRSKNIPTKQMTEWDDRLRTNLLQFATTAWRRPLASDEQQEIINIYNEARKKELDQESSAREAMVRALISPKFLFKLESGGAGMAEVERVNAWELATRVSYFIWSSMPDTQLRAAAADGSLLKPEVLTQQVKRMLRDPRSMALAKEFGGQWLQFNGFADHNSVDLVKYPDCTPELRGDMQQEAISFFNYIVREDRPVREVLQADYTFLNQRLAKYYGIPGVQGEEFQKISVSAYHRGGMLGMGSILTKTSYPLRTSPVLRGNWILKSVLGTPVPPPPNNVPKLDEDTSKPKSLRERLERHRADKACSVCHDKIDPLGFALEDFDAVGRLRTKDEAGVAIDDTGLLKDGTKLTGLDGLRNYLATRENDFEALLCRKLVGFAVGRQVMPTDRPLIDEMQQNLRSSEGRFSSAVLSVVQSKQFQYRRNE